MAKYETDQEARSERNERIINLRTSTLLTDREIGERVGVSSRTVQRVLRDAELTKGERWQAPHPQEKWDEIEEWLRREQGSFTEASRTFGVDASTIAHHFPELGWRRSEAALFAGSLSQFRRSTPRVQRHLLRMLGNS